MRDCAVVRYRMTSDWHGWHGADGKPGWPNHFELAGTYSQYIGAPGAHGLSWPDLDMLNPFKGPWCSLRTGILVLFWTSLVSSPFWLTLPVP